MITYFEEHKCDLGTRPRRLHSRTLLISSFEKNSLNTPVPNVNIKGQRSHTSSWSCQGEGHTVCNVIQLWLKICKRHYD